MPADPVDRITDEIRAIWDEMIDTMEAMPGVGLAAPQIGVMQRLAVVERPAPTCPACPPP
jgi:peptide deformylase